MRRGVCKDEASGLHGTMYPRFLTQTMNLPASFRASLTFLLTEATCMSTALPGGVREVPPELVRNGRARDGLAAGAQKQPQDGGLVMRERHEPARRPKVLPFEGDRAPGKVEGAACARENRQGAHLQLLRQPWLAKEVSAPCQEGRAQGTGRTTGNHGHSRAGKRRRVGGVRDIEVRERVAGTRPFSTREMKRASPQGSPHSFENDGVESDHLHRVRRVRGRESTRSRSTAYSLGGYAVSSFLCSQSGPSWP